MSIIPIIYNQGTGLINPIGEGSGLPIIVDDLVVNGNLTVLGTSNLIGDVTCDSNLTVASTTTTEDLIVNNNTILDNGVGQNSLSLFKLPLSNGVNGEVLTITNDSTNPIITEWQPSATINDYVQYDTLTSKLKNNVLSVVSNINDLTVDNSIGLTNQRFKLPSNTSTATNNQVLAILNSAVNPKTTSWVPQSIFNITSGVVDNFSTGTTTTTNVASTLINTPVLQAGIYIINYEVVILIIGTRSFTYQGNGITTSAGSLFNNPVFGLRQASSIPYASSVLVIPESSIITGCGVINITSPTTLYLITFNKFSGGTYTTAGSIRYTKIS